MGTIASPLLAGFSLAAIVALVSAEKPPPLADLAVAALVGAAAVLLLALQFALHALKYGTPPNARLDAWPEGTTKPAVLEELRQIQARDRDLAQAFADRARFFYNCGLLAFFLALIFVAYPKDWNVATAATFVLAVAAGFVELWWATKGTGDESGLRFPGRPFVPTVEATPALSELDDRSRAAAMNPPAGRVSSPTS